LTSTAVVTEHAKLELLIVFDTNAIYTAGGGLLLSQESSQLIKGSTGDERLGISWYLPDVVVEERRYQIVQEADKLRAGVSKFERFIGHAFNLTDDEMRRRIADNIQEQIREHHLGVFSADLSDVNWSDVVASALSRRPPFDPAPNVEKGFRDALILEGFMQLVRHSPSDAERCRIVLLTRDGLLAKAAAARADKSSNVTVLKTIDEVKGLINTLLSSLTEEAVAAFRATAKTFFFDQDSQGGIFKDLGIASRIRAECRVPLEALPPGADLRQNEWKWLIASGPSFVRKVNDRMWWSSKVKVRSEAFQTTFLPNAYSPSIFDADVPENRQSSYTWVSSGEQNPNVTVPSSTTFVVSGTPVMLSPAFSNALTIPSSSGFTVANSPFTAANPPFNLSNSPSTYATASTVVGTPWRQLTARGVSTIVVNWSVAVDTQGRFSSPRVEGIDFVGTEWENV
jgi:hypothetical protein